MVKWRGKKRKRKNKKKKQIVLFIAVRAGALLVHKKIVCAYSKKCYALYILFMFVFVWSLCIEILISRGIGKSVCVCCVSFFVSISFFGWLESRHSQNALVHVKPQNDWPMISGTETDSVEENGIEHFLFMKRSIEQATDLPTKSSVFISFPIDYEIIKIWFFELEITTDMNETRFLGFICISLMLGSKL